MCNINTADKNILNLRDYTLNYLNNLFEIKKLPISQHLAYKEVFKDGKKFALESFGYEIENLAHIHGAIMESDGVENFNLIIFPNNDQKLPLFAAEFLFFAYKPYLTIVDIQTLWKDKEKTKIINKNLGLLKHKYKHLPSGGKVSAWAEEYFSENTIYTRPNLEHLTDIINAYKDYLHFYIDILRNVDLRDLEQTYKSSNKYKKHHADSYPGIEYLKKVFGEKWVSEYFNDFMYRQR